MGDGGGEEGQGCGEDEKKARHDGKECVGRKGVCGKRSDPTSETYRGLNREWASGVDGQ